ncbi:DUF1622 domain-containing protein [Marilutibacter aestuarii]|uniref:DUF1622 domain-containing protein n=1 Tax=Marilutibacter aestuarii TaxID=1706195 RepID=A0A508A6C4_9GAMM|nr:DUF1622 domain-containing protein [Lysobacter aestuarii]TQD43964.1 DUF1622 domain-containing protein [Lysobacter aestuarii]
MLRAHGRATFAEAAVEELFLEVSEYIALGLEALSVLTILIGAIDALIRMGPALRVRRGSHGARRAAWLSLARWLLLGLEFMLAADIVRTAISPDWNDIGQLAAIAVIRTFLNFFLERDLDAAEKMSSEAEMPERDLT